MIRLGRIAAGFLALSAVGCAAPKAVEKPLSVNASHHSLFLDHATLSSSATSSGRLHWDPKDDPFSRSYRGSEKIDPAIANALQVKYASLLHIAPQRLTNIGLYSFVDVWYGTPYLFGGTGPGGIDCSAFMQRVFSSVYGVNLVRTAIEQFGVTRTLWDFEDLKEGDLVFFRTTGSRISHVGMYLANNFFVHSSSSRGVTISALTEHYWTRTFAGAGRLL